MGVWFRTSAYLAQIYFSFLNVIFPVLLAQCNSYLYIFHLLSGICVTCSRKLNLRSFLSFSFSFSGIYTKLFLLFIFVKLLHISEIHFASLSTCVGFMKKKRFKKIRHVLFYFFVWDKITDCCELNLSTFFTKNK